MANSTVGIFYRFLLRCMVVSALFKGGLDILMFGRDTPRLIVSRSHFLLTNLQKCIFIDQDPVMRFVMLN